MAKFTSSLILAMSAALLTSACATTKPASPDEARLPTEQWTSKVGVAETPRSIRLAPHADGLSQTQASALTDFATRWAGEGGGEMKVIHARDPAAALLGAQAASYLRQAGVTGVSLQAVDAPAGTPVEIGYSGLEIEAPLCGQKIGSYTATASNGVDANFGCAVTANKALMAANPQDLIRPRAASQASGERAVEAITRSLQSPTASAGGSSSSSTTSSGGTN